MFRQLAKRDGRRRLQTPLRQQHLVYLRANDRGAPQAEYVEEFIPERLLLRALGPITRVFA